MHSRQTGAFLNPGYVRPSMKGRKVASLNAQDDLGQQPGFGQPTSGSRLHNASSMGQGFEDLQPEGWASQSYSANGLNHLGSGSSVVAGTFGNAGTYDNVGTSSFGPSAGLQDGFTDFNANASSGSFTQNGSIRRDSAHSLCVNTPVSDPTSGAQVNPIDFRTASSTLTMDQFITWMMDPSTDIPEMRSPFELTENFEKMEPDESQG